MNLDKGRRLGPYEIESPAGSGGMGEVYRAKDTRLDRTVLNHSVRHATDHDVHIHVHRRDDGIYVRREVPLGKAVRYAQGPRGPRQVIRLRELDLVVALGNRRELVVSISIHVGRSVEGPVAVDPSLPQSKMHGRLKHSQIPIPPDPDAFKFKRRRL